MRLRDVEWTVSVTEVEHGDDEFEIRATLNGRFIWVMYYNFAWLSRNLECVPGLAQSWTDQVVQRLVDILLSDMYKKVREEVLS